ncbi:MAG: FHA domain-containing protein [Anaerolineaceae bacterium]|nr:FHA domain-containing protein [Anaerolineaceae bacterium]
MEEFSQKQRLLEKRLQSIWSAGVSGSAIVRDRFGPLETWQISLGNHQLLLHPVHQMWYYFDQLHQTWEPSGLKPGMGHFVLANGKLGWKLNRPEQELARQNVDTLLVDTNPCYLEIELPDHTAKKKVLGSSRVLIGRGAEADIQLAHHLVSRIHAALEPTPQGWVIRDLNSSNGTFLNGKRLEIPHPLKPGEIIQIGDCRIIFRVEKD